jgi:hypothetical protein
MEVYDPASNAWNYGVPMPYSLGGTRAAVIGGKIYVFALGATLVYDSSSNAWSTLTAMPTYRSDFALVTDTSLGWIYAIGGSTGAADVASVEAYIPSVDQWLELAPLPTSLEGLVAYDSGQLTALSGYDPYTYVCTLTPQNTCPTVPSKAAFAFTPPSLAVYTKK